MNAFRSILLVALLALSACLLVSAGKLDGLETEIDDDSQVEPDGGIDSRVPEKIDDWWGSHDMIEQGIPKAVEWKKSECAHNTKPKECQACCEVTGMAGFIRRKPGIKFMKHECHCAKLVNED